MDYKVGELRKDQVAAREYYMAMLEMDNHQQTMCIGEQRAVAEPVKELEEVILNDSRPEWTTRMGTLASWPVREALTTFLKDNQDVFAWSHEVKCIALIFPNPAEETSIHSRARQSYSRGSLKVA